MLKRFTLALLLAASLSGVATAACTSGFISIIDPFLNPNATPWSGSIVYTLAYNTTVAGATIVGSRQQFNVTSGINLCLAPGLYSPVTLQQGGFSFSITNSWGVPASGGPYTIAQIQGNITLQAPGLQSNTITVTNGQMLALNATAITLVPAIGPGIVAFPTRILAEQVIGFAGDAVTQPGGTGGNVYITTWYVTFTVQ